MSPLFQEKQTTPSSSLVTLRSLFKQLTLPPFMSTGVFSSRPKKLSRAHFNPHSSKCSADRLCTSKVSTELFSLCLDCHTDFPRMNVFVSHPHTRYKLTEDKASILAPSVTETSFVTTATCEALSPLPYFCPSAIWWEPPRNKHIALWVAKSFHLVGNTSQNFISSSEKATQFRLRMCYF